MNLLIHILLGAAGYFLGSISPAGFLTHRIGGINIRQQGSGNPGTTNVLRTMGWKVGVLTFLADFAKGLLPALLISLFWGRTQAYVVAAGVLLGHAFPAFDRLKGGKCVASGIAVCVGLFPVGGLAMGVFSLIIMLLTRIVSIGSLVGFALYAVALFLVPGEWLPDPILKWFTLVLAAFIFILHRANIQRIFRGEEKRLQVARKSK